MKVGIIGAGIVGGAIEHWFSDAHELFIHDPVRGTTLADVTDNVDMAYIAVPTPQSEVDGSCDTSIVESILDELPDGFTAVIKSTVVPGTTQRYHDEYSHLKIAYSPEFLVERRALEDFGNQDILVCGTHHADVAERVFQQHREAGVLKKEQTFQVTPTQAELVKYTNISHPDYTAVCYYTLLYCVTCIVITIHVTRYTYSLPTIYTLFTHYLHTIYILFTY